MPIDALLLDCDGVLVDSEPLAHEVMVECLAEIGLALSLDDGGRFVGRRMADCVADLEAQFGCRLPETFVPSYRDRLHAAFGARLRPMDGAAELLQSLTIPFCVASGGPRAKVERSLDVTGLRRWFRDDRIFSSYDVGSWKPDPGLILHAAAAMGVAPARCAVVEDSDVGIAAGLAAGMQVIALGRAVAAPHSSVHHLSEVRSVLSA